MSKPLKWAAVTPMLAGFNKAVAALKTQMVRNLPQTISGRLAGLMSSVSMVPRSFSPTVTSRAGAMQPTKVRKIIRYGINPPNRFAATFFGGAAFCSFTSKGTSAAGDTPSRRILRSGTSR